MNLKYDVPNGWSFPTFEELASQENGGIRIGPFGSALKKEEYVESGIGVLGIEHVLPNRFCWDTPKYIPKEKYAELTQYTVKPGDVLVTNMGTVGRACFVPDGIETSIISSHLIKATLDADRCDPKYLCYVMNESSMVKAQIKAKSHGAIMAGFNSSLLKSLRIPLPPLPMQRRITAVLDKAQALVANDKRTLAVYDQLAKSLFLEMFGDPVRNERGWESQKLDDLCQSIVVGFVGACEQFYTGSDGVPMVRTGNLREGVLDFSNMKYVTRDFHLKQRKSQLQKGDILIARHGDNGKASLYDGRFPEANSLNIVVLRPNVKKMLPDFLINVMNFPTMRTFIASRTGGATQKVVNTKEIQRLEFIVPPVTDQKRFAEKLVHVNVQMTKAATSLRRSEGLFGSLLQRAFAGELG